MDSEVQKVLPLRRIPAPPAAKVKAKSACDFCRVKKLKCDCVVIGCTTCQQHRVPCQYGLTPAKRRRYEIGCARRHAALVPPTKLFPAPLFPTDIFTGPFPPVADSRTASIFPEQILPIGDTTLPLLPITIVGNIRRLRDISFVQASVDSITWEIITQFLHRLHLTTDRCSSFAGKFTTNFSKQALVDASINTIDHSDDIDEWLNLLNDRYALPLMTGSSSPSPNSTSGPLVHRGSRLDHFTHVANSKLGPLQSLFRASDLMFHSNVIHYHVYIFTHVCPPEAENQHYQRLLHRLSTRTFPIPLMLALLNMMSAISNHPVFRDLSPSEAGLIYHQHLQGLVPFCLERHDSDLMSALLFATKSFLDEGYYPWGFP